MAIFKKRTLLFNLDRNCHWSCSVIHACSLCPSKKGRTDKERPGNYQSLKCASDGSPFSPIPDTIRSQIPHGIVVFFENNQTTHDSNLTLPIKSWVIESAGSFRSERLFILAQEINPGPKYEFYRASELYLTPVKGLEISTFEKELNEDKFKIIGENSQSGEWILQIKNFPHWLFEKR